tara:strand:- start:168 stop:545 length:378 start_codon:yes stop_codon:yes gene_type:complete
MAQTTIYLKIPINQSCQVGDFVYYAPTSTSSDFDIANYDNIVAVGEILSISNEYVGDPAELAAALVCEIDSNTNPPQPNDFIFFVKDRRVGETSLLGYFGEFEVKNNSRDRAELFMMGCEVTPNS